MGKALKDRKLKFETLQLHVGQEEADPVTGARAVPIYQTSSYVFNNSEHAAARFGLTDAGNIYGRLTNPTEDVFEQRIAALEGGVAALAVASGAAAIAYTLQNLAHAGEHIVAANNIYGGTYNLLAHTFPEYGITTTFVDPFNYDEVEQAIQENTRAIHIETLGNPNSDVVDIEKIAAIAHAHQIPLVVDNTFATPYLVRPLEYGAATTASVLQRRQDRQRSSQRSAPFYCATPVQPSLRSTLSCFYRDLRHCRCVWSAMWRMH